MSLRTPAALLCALLGFAMASAPMRSQAPASRLGWDEVVWYEVFVRSFQDSDGDGIGDLRGLMARLPYLSELGVGGLWLMPTYPSPSYHGYDVTDYEAVAPEYGTVADMRELLAEAHASGLRVILDFVPNHTSRLHPWFLAALGGDEYYRAFYRFEPDPPPIRGTRGGSAWHATPAGDYYLGLFGAGMPDLNLTNPDATAALYRAADFWLELGVDGFRIDAIQHLVEGEDGQISNTAATYAWVKGFEEHLHAVAPHAFLVGETWTEMPAIVRYHRDADLDMSFDYPLWKAVLAALQSRSAADLADTLAQERDLYPYGAVRGTFLTNHDQTRHATRLSVPRRDEPRLALAAGLLLTLPGTPFVYYGEELGMPDGPGSGDLEKRTPMRWAPVGPDGAFGFTTGSPWTDPGPGQPGVSVAEQVDEPGSLLNRYRRLIAMRNERDALRSSVWSVLRTSSRAVLAVERVGADETLLVLANLAARAVELGADELAGYFLADALTGAELQAGAGGGLSLPGLSLYVLRAW